MSSQIRKVLGYALTDLQGGDPRINWKSPLLDYSTASTFGAFADHLGSVQAPRFSRLDIAAEDVRNAERAKPLRRLDSCVVHNPDSGLPGVMVLVPPSCSDEWLRYDDIFDYVEAHFNDEPTVDPVMKEIETGIYPFDGLWMDRQTGAEVQKVGLFRRLLQSGTASPEDLLYAARKISLLPDFDEKAALAALTSCSPEKAQAVESEPLFRDAGAAVDRLVRLVSPEIRELVMFGQLFTDEHLWKALRPVHYTYWT